MFIKIKNNKFSQLSFSEKIQIVSKGRCVQGTCSVTITHLDKIFEVAEILHRDIVILSNRNLEYVTR